MKIRKGLLAMTVGGAMALGLAFVPEASAQRVVVVRPFVGYRAYYGPAWGWGYGYGYYPRPAYVVSATTGDVKIKTKAKEDTIYVDGGYIGTTHDMKKFSLRAGNHDIEVRDPEGRSLFHQKVQVLIGKTVEIQMNG
jgi:PEGA domain